MTPAPLRHRRPSLVAFALLALALALRVHGLAEQSLSYDEAVSVYLARLPLADMLRWTATDVQPPLYYLSLKAWLPLAGPGEYAVRFPSALAATLAVALFYRFGRDFAGTRAGLIAALVAALHPWYAWHAQDARMYSQLLLLCLIASWLLLSWCRLERRLSPQLPPTAHLAIRVALPLAYAAAMYTHYLAALLFVYHLLLVALGAARERRWRLLCRYAGSVTLPAVLLYLPWLPAVLATYRSDTSYYPGPLKLGEIAADAFVALFVGGVGETVYERQGLLLAAVLATAMIAAIVASRRNVARERIAMVAGGLVVPALCSLALLAALPKFSPRYLMPASIALPMLWALALSAPCRGLGRAATLSATVLLATVSAATIVQSRSDASFTRPDFRSAVATVLGQIAPGERVVLSSGHMYPVWQYYAPETPYLPVPALRVLSVDAIVTLDDLPSLAESLDGATGVWLLRWQDGVTDPTGVIPYALSAAARSTNSRQFWHLTLDHYDLAAALPASPLATAAYLGANFGSLVTLVAADTTLDGSLALFWQASSSIATDLRGTLTLTDADGREVHRQPIPLAADGYPTTRWPSGQTVLGRIRLQPRAGLPEGRYSASISVYDAATAVGIPVLDASGASAGMSYPLGQLSMPDGTRVLPADDAAAALSMRALSGQFDGLRLIATGTCPASALPPGARFSLPLLWQVTGSHDERALAASLQCGGGSVSLAADPLAVSIPTYTWRQGDVVQTWLDVAVPASFAAGDAALVLGPHDATNGAGSLTLCAITVAEVAHSYSRPEVQHRGSAEVGGFARLLGASTDVAEAAPGDTVTATVYWQAVATPEGNYVAFVHLLGPDGRVWAQSDAEPLGGARPTAGWMQGEVIADTVALALPPDAPIGRYQLEVGFFDAARPGSPRLPAQENGEPLAGDAVRLGELLVR